MPPVPPIKPIVIGNCKLYRGKAELVLPRLDQWSCDALVCDPPAGIAFVGKEWDRPDQGIDTFPIANLVGSRADNPDLNGFAKGVQFDSSRKARYTFIDWLTGILRKAFLALKPGAWGLVWALPRTSHWTGMALENAGFEVRDRIAHVFGSGFPKSKFCLKPAVEDWWLVRKHGGSEELRIDDCRVSQNGVRQSSTGGLARGGSASGGKDASVYSGGWSGGDRVPIKTNIGRWPPNLVLSHHSECRPALNGSGCVAACPVRQMDEQSGPQQSVRVKRGKGIGNGYGGKGAESKYDTVRGYADQGGASRFFPTFEADLERLAFYYCPKASTSDRNEGCDELPDVTIARSNGAQAATKRGENYDNDDGNFNKTTSGKNHHATVKSTTLMEWLVRLITDEDMTVLDPFMGSGSTGKACVRVRRRFVGIEQDRDYFKIAEARIRHVDGIDEVRRRCETLMEGFE